MLVTLNFEKNGNQYRIERGRSPNILKFYINDQEQVDEFEDNSQGDSRKTQEAIQELLGMSHNMFKHIVALNTYTEPFLSMRTNDQREIIEQLLGITILSEKATLLKEEIRATKDALTEETMRIEAVQKSNEKIKVEFNYCVRASVFQCECCARSRWHWPWRGISPCWLSISITAVSRNCERAMTAPAR